MKIIRSLLPLIAFSLSVLDSGAEPVKLLSFKIAGVDKQAKSIAEFSQLAMNPMLSPILSAKLADNPFVKFFGPSRGDAAMAGIVYVEGDALSSATNSLDKEWFDDNDLAVIYPVKRPKAGFLAAHPDAVETNGFLYVESDVELFSETFVAFSPDGMWAVASSKEKYLVEAMKEIPYAISPMDGENIIVETTPALVGLIPKLAMELHLDSEEDRKVLEQACDVLKMVETMGCSVKIGSSGIDFAASVKPVEGTPLALSGETPLADNPFASHPQGAAFAAAYAKNSGYNPKRDSRQMNEVVAAANKQGLKTDFVSVSEKDSLTSIVLDVPAQIAYFNGEGAEAVSKFRAAEFLEAIQKTKAETSGPVWDGEAFGTALSLKNGDVEPSLGKRLKASFPEYSAKKPYMVSVISLYPTLKTVFAQILDNLPSGKAGAMAPVLKMQLAALPPPGDKATVCASWKENGEIKGLLRITADEIRGISSFTSLAIGLAMQSKMSSPRPACPFECDDDDDDDDDEEE